MVSEIKSGLYHSASTDNKPQHTFCPKGVTSWCKYNVNVANRQTFIQKNYTKEVSPLSVIKRSRRIFPDYKHPRELPAAVMDELKPIHSRLSKSELLDKCLHGQTQNPSIH